MVEVEYGKSIFYWFSRLSWVIFPLDTDDVENKLFTRLRLLFFLFLSEWKASHSRWNAIRALKVYPARANRPRTRSFTFLPSITLGCASSSANNTQIILNFSGLEIVQLESWGRFQADPNNPKRRCSVDFDVGRKTWLKFDIHCLNLIRVWKSVKFANCCDDDGGKGSQFWEGLIIVQDYGGFKLVFFPLQQTQHNRKTVNPKRRDNAIIKYSGNVDKNFFHNGWIRNTRPLVYPLGHFTEYTFTMSFAEQ